MPNQPKPTYEVQTHKDITYLPNNEQGKCDIYIPANIESSQRFPAIVIIHGGGWCAGDKADPREQNIANTLTAQGYVCASINYTLCSKDNPTWPLNLRQCEAAIAFLHKNADCYHIIPNRIGVIGGSAGGHLSAMLGLTAPNPPQAVVDLYGVGDLLQWPDSSFVADYLGVTKTDSSKTWTDASPFHNVHSDVPPFLIIHGTKDETVPYQQSIDLDRKLKEHGNHSDLLIIENAVHSFDLQPPQQDIRQLVIDFFDKHLKG
jgi:acetyl esterase/lipase